MYRIAAIANATMAIGIPISPIAIVCGGIVTSAGRVGGVIVVVGAGFSTFVFKVTIWIFSTINVAAPILSVWLIPP